MKMNIFLIVFAMMGFASTANAQSCHKSKKVTEKSCHQQQATPTTAVDNTAKVVLAAAEITHNETATFTVYGNCGMCERTIEGALKGVAGVMSADWDRETDKMTVTFNPHTIALDAIKQKIADVGYDSDTHRAEDAVYNNLPGCCQYERPVH